MGKPSFIPVGALIAALLAPVAVSAQESGGAPPPAQARRPFRGLFGQPPDLNSRESLDLTASLFGAYDDDVLAEQSGISGVAPGPQESGWFGGAQLGLAYARRNRRVNLSASGDVGLNYYPKRDETSPVYRTGVGLGIQLARRTQLSVDGSFVYAPYYRLGFIPSATDPIGFEDPFLSVVPDYDLFKTSSYRSSGGVTLSQLIGRHSSLAMSYSIGLIDYVNEDLDYRSQSGGIQFAHQLSRNLGFHARYAYTTAEYTQQPSVSQRNLHDIDIGVDYGRALSISRRTHLSFSTGSSMVLSDQEPLNSGNRNLHYRLLGNAMLTHEMGRTWTASAGYSRDVMFHEGFIDPFLSDAVTASLNGYFSRKVQFTSNAVYSIGSVGFNTGNDYYASSVTANLQYALSRILALYVRYVSYRYSFDERATLDPRFARSLNRQGVRLGVQASFPIIR